TATVSGELGAPAAAIVRTPSYSPAASSSASKPILIVSASPVDAPNAGDGCIQSTFDAIVYSSVLPPPFTTVNVCAAGFCPTWQDTSMLFVERAMLGEVSISVVTKCQS